MLRRPPRSTLTDPLFPYTTLFRSLRSCLYEYGYVVPQGIHQIRRIAEILDAPNSDLPDLMREECRDLLEQIAEKTGRINARTAKIKRSEERRVGQECVSTCRSRWSPSHEKKNNKHMYHINIQSTKKYKIMREKQR